MFSSKPYMVFINGAGYETDSSPTAVFVLNSKMLTESGSYPKFSFQIGNITWTDNSVKWYNTWNSRAQLNNDSRYYYVSLLIS